MRKMTSLVVWLFVNVCFCITTPGQQFTQCRQQPQTAAVSLQDFDNNLQSLPPDAASAISGVLGRNLPGYSASSGDAFLEVCNAQQHLVAGFMQGKVQLQSGNRFWEMTLAGFGHGSAIHAIGSARPVAEANRVEYTYPELKEWYVNGPAGLEQGFTVIRPESSPSGGPLTISLHLSGNLVPALSGQDGLVLSDRGGNPVLRYAGLTSYDARGTALHSWLELKGDVLLLRVEDRGAVYPVIIDPITQLAELTGLFPSMGTNAQLGARVSISGDTVVAGVPGINGNKGAVYVFVKPSSGWSNMIQTAVLTASDGASNDDLGASVAISGDIVVAGAPLATEGSNMFQGAAYIFQKPPGGWSSMTQTAKLIASDGAFGDWFGFSVSISGQVVAVGASQGEFRSAPGKAYVFVPLGLGWRQAAELTVSGGSANAHLGSSIATTGSTVVAGAPFETIGSNTAQGAAFVFVEPPGGWSSENQTAELTASDGAVGDFLGWSVAISGSAIVSGAIANLGQGAAYVFVEPSGGWVNNTQTAKLTASDGAAGANLGQSVSFSANVVIAGASGAMIGGNSSQGAVYVYSEPPLGWTNMTQTAKITSSDGAGGDKFGSSVSLDAAGDGVGVVGAPSKTVNGASNAGAAYVFGSI